MPVYTKLYGAFLAFAVIAYYLTGWLKLKEKSRVTVSKTLLLFLNLIFYAYAGLKLVFVLGYVVLLSFIYQKISRKYTQKWIFGITAAGLFLPLILLKTCSWLKVPGIVLPLGISFFTLQAFTYVDSARSGQLEDTDFLSAALFISFFPSISSGPILRSGDVIPQFQSVHRFEYEKFTGGMKLIAWGLMKKLVLADNMAVYFAHVTGEAFTKGNVSGTALLLSSVMYSFQLYLDFSGYSDIVIGSAALLGFDIKKNFDHPYTARTISEFWRRWHISLSSWLRDYVYFPLGGSRTKELLIYRNLMIVFIISGLWHGNGMTFLVWGLLHGLFSCIDRLLRKKTGFQGSRILTFIAVTFAWIFFAAASVENAVFTIGSFARIPGELASLFTGESTVRRLFLISDETNLPLLLAGLAVFCAISLFTKDKEGLEIIGRQKAAVRWGLYFALILCIMLFSASAPVNFIYNQF